MSFIAEIDRYDDPYSFNLFRVEERGGKFFYATDSGCSCPTPFEDHVDSDWDEIVGDRFDEFSKEFYSWAGRGCLTLKEKRDFLADVLSKMERQGGDGDA